MSALVVALLALAGVAYLAAWRMTMGHIAWSCSYTWNQKKPDASDWCVGFLGGALWPVIAALWAAKSIAQRAVTKEVLPVIGAERRAAEERRAKHVAALERDAGYGGL